MKNRYDKSIHPTLESQSHTPYSHFVEGLLEANAEGEIIDANEHVATLLGRSREALLGSQISELMIYSIEENGALLSPFDNPVAVALGTGTVSTKLIGVPLTDRSRRWLVVRSWPRSVRGLVVGAMCSLIDVTAQLRQLRITQMFMTLNGCVTQSDDEAELSQELCDRVASEGRYPLVWVAVATTGRDHTVAIAYAVGPSTDDLFGGATSWSEQVITEIGLVETAIRTGVAQVDNDIYVHPGFERLGDRGRATQVGLASGIAVPLKIGARSAVLSVYARDKFAFDKMTVQGFEKTAAELGFAYLPESPK
ncbi:MAG: GAF domain-containing protein [Acidimicrobiales bacterium]